MPTPLFGVSGAPEALILQNSLLAGNIGRAGDHLHYVASQSGLRVWLCRTRGKSRNSAAF